MRLYDVDNDMLFWLDNYKWRLFNKHMVTTINKNNVHMHNYIWTFYNGKIPTGYRVIHKDNNSLNNKLINLELQSSIKNNRRVGRSHTVRLKIKAFNILGGACVMCGNTDIRCLQIDHIIPLHNHYDTLNEHGVFFMEKISKRRNN